MLSRQYSNYGSKSCSKAVTTEEIIVNCRSVVNFIFESNQIEHIYQNNDAERTVHSNHLSLIMRSGCR